MSTVCVLGVGALNRSCVEEKSCVACVLCYFGALVIRFGGRHVCATFRATPFFLVALLLLQACMGRGHGPASSASWARQAKSEAGYQEGDVVQACRQA